jgi:hypothetical protein
MQLSTFTLPARPSSPSHAYAVLPLLCLWLAPPLVGALALVSSLVYFPEDPTEGADMFGATLRFAHAAARRLAEVDGDIATAAAAHGPALSTLYSESGFDFDPHWPDIMRPLCVNCTLISLLSSGILYSLCLLLSRVTD